jgi:hypothetical protein
MLKNILHLNGVTSLKKEQQLHINGGMANACIRECRQDFADCREDGHSHCATSLSICQASC